MKTCQVAGCNRPSRARKMCKKHYEKWRKTGTLEFTHFSHGHTRHGVVSPTYSSWRAMKKRCNNPNVNNYHRYGAIGISVCKRWEKFENFIADMGERPDGTTLDRIDSNKNYMPSNCRWASYSTQRLNRRDKK